MHIHTRSTSQSYTHTHYTQSHSDTHTCHGPHCHHRPRPQTSAVGETPTRPTPALTAAHRLPPHPLRRRRRRRRGHCSSRSSPRPPPRPSAKRKTTKGGGGGRDTREGWWMSRRLRFGTRWVGCRDTHPIHSHPPHIPTHTPTHPDPPKHPYTPAAPRPGGRCAPPTILGAGRRARRQQMGRRGPAAFQSGCHPPSCLLLVLLLLFASVVGWLGGPVCSSGGRRPACDCVGAGNRVW
jgi:hypothetical protein